MNASKGGWGLIGHTKPGLIDASKGVWALTGPTTPGLIDASSEGGGGGWLTGPAKSVVIPASKAT